MDIIQEQIPLYIKDHIRNNGFNYQFHEDDFRQAYRLLLKKDNFKREYICHFEDLNNNIYSLTNWVNVCLDDAKIRINELPKSSIIDPKEIDCPYAGIY